VDVGLHHGGVHAHSAPGHQPVGLSQLHQPLVNLLDHLGPHRHAPTSHRLRIGRLAGADAGEVAVHQIGAHLALQHAIAPVADVLEDQQAQHHLGRRAQPTATATLGMPPRQRFVHRSYDLFIRQHPVGVCHPLFAEIAHFLSDQSIAEAELSASHLNHGSSPRALPRLSPDAANRG
jgi:hypothetical protein